MEVKIKDREEKTEYLRMAINMCELPLDYTHADLIIKLHKELEVHEGNLSVRDVVKVFSDWKQEWETYYYKSKKDTE